MCRIGARPYMMCPRLQLTVGKRPCLGLLDSGSAVSLIDERVFGEMGAKLEPTDLKLHSALAQLLQVKGVANVRIRIGGFVWKYRFVVASNLPFEVIVGADFMCKTGLVMDLQEGHVYFKFCPEGKIVMGVRNVRELRRSVRREIRFSRRRRLRKVRAWVTLALASRKLYGVLFGISVKLLIRG